MAAGSWLERKLPTLLLPYAQLIRLDKPIGESHATNPHALDPFAWHYHIAILSYLKSDGSCPGGIH